MKKHKCKLINDVCPENGDASKGDYCPFWNETDQNFLMTDVTNNRQKIEQCAAKVLVFGQIEVIKASNRPAKAIEQVNNTISNGFASIGKIFELSARKADNLLAATAKANAINHGNEKS